MSLRKRIQVLLIFLVAIPLFILLFETSRSSHRALVEQMKEQSLQIANLQAANMDLIFVPARQTAEGVARTLETVSALEPEAIKGLLRQSLDHAPDLYGMSVALEPSASPAGRFAPYVYRKDGSILERTLDGPAYEYPRWDWFRLPMAMGRGLWTHPYFDRGGGDILMITYSAPFRRAGRLAGVVTVDLSLENLVKRLEQLHPGGSGTVYLANKFGQILPPPTGSAADRDPRTVTGLKALLDHLGTDTLEMADPVSHRRSWVVETPVRSMTADQGGRNWSVIVSWPLGKRLEPVIKLAERVFCLFLFLGGAVFLFLNRAFDQVITRPVRRLAEQARRYALGDFTVKHAHQEEALELQDLSLALGKLGAALAETRRPDAGPGRREP